MTTATKGTQAAQPRPLPAPIRDFYQTLDVLNDAQKAVVQRVRSSACATKLENTCNTLPIPCKHA